jgi:tripartite ATP-independent transporter DctM subunit
LHVNVVGCSIFAAISGSSAATTQVVGRVTLGELLSRGYDKNIAMGSLAGAGTLGFLIPPSSIMIVYGVLAQVSVLKLFAAGLIPGLLLASCFMVWVMIHTTLRPDLVPRGEREMRQASWGDRFSALSDLAPTTLLILAVLGSMYGGVATPSEAAAFGVVGALVISLVQRKLTLEALKEVGTSSVHSCAMIALILLGASILGGALASLGVPAFVSGVAKSLELPPLALIVALILFYLVLGCFLEGFSMIVMTVPVTLPIVIAAGYDPIWFGIFLVLVVEMAQIHPPVGFNLFVIQSITGENLVRITKSALPYLLILMLFTIFVALVPQVVMWLPRHI